MIVVAIVAVIIFFASGIGSGKAGMQKPVATTAFEKKIQERVDKEVKDKAYAEAHQAYNAIMDAINTEASITLGDGSKKLKDSEARKCRQMLFYEFSPIFTEYGMGYLAGHNWSEATLNSLRSEASSLQSMSIAESGTDVANKLATISRTVNDYFKAWTLARSAASASSPQAINSLKSQAAAYRYAPLSNCTELQTALNNMGTVARNHVAQGVASYAQGVASRCTGYGNYEGWLSARDEALSRLNSFASSYGGSTSEIQAARSALKAADDRALDYYSERLANSERSKTSSPSANGSQSSDDPRAASNDDSDEDW